MHISDFNEKCKYWHENDTGQRLGQFLINESHTLIEDDDIYYERDKTIAAGKFFRSYVKFK